jgi:glyoxylase-like metal-dependent hydrolase (beta-lactamase superfamily II)
MKVSVIDAGNFKLDGGAMFGMIPKTLWQKQIPADENNLCTWKTRCLLVEDVKKLVLIDTGMGDKQPQKWQNHYYRHGEGDLITGIRAAGYHENDITDVILSHLHFDHCGGALKLDANSLEPIPTFQNATYWTHQAHWDWAKISNPKEKGTFLAENILPLEKHGVLKFINHHPNYFSENWQFLYSDGHTQKMIMPIINVNGQKIVFAADCVPSFAHIHIPYVMAYDNFPLTTMKEKADLFDRLISDNIALVFDHDAANEYAFIEKTERGFIPKTMGYLNEILK